MAGGVSEMHRAIKDGLHGRLQGCIAFPRLSHGNIETLGITYDFFENIMHTIAQFGAAFEPV